MSRRLVIAATLLAAPACLLIALWLLRPAESASSAPPRGIATTSSANAETNTQSSTPVTSSEPEVELDASPLPLGLRTAVEPLSEHPSPVTPTRVLVGALAIGGRPLADVLKVRWPHLPMLEATWTRDIDGPVPTRREIEFQLLPGSGSDNHPEKEDLQVPGYVCTLSVDERLPVRVLLHLDGAVVATQLVQPGEDAAWFDIGARDVDNLTGTVRGQVVAKGTGSSPPGATVAVRDTFPSLFRIKQATQAKPATTEGRFEIEGILAGAAFLVVEADGFEERVLKIQVPRGRGIDVGAIELDTGLTCPGHVVDADGSPIRATVRLRAAEDSADVIDQIVMGRSCQSDADGRFSFDGLGHDRYVIFANARQREDGREQSAHLVLDTRQSDPPGELSVELRREVSVELRGLVDNRSWTDLALFGESGVLLLTMDDAMLRLMASPVADKPFSMPIPAGHYSVRVAKGSHVVWVKDFDVVSEPLTIDLPP